VLQHGAKPALREPKGVLSGMAIRPCTGGGHVSSGSGRSASFPDAQFDVVLSTLMLHHLPRPVRQRCMREIRRVLRRDGRVLVVDFAKGQDTGSVLAHLHRHGHVDPQAILSLLTDVGLYPIRSGGVGISSLKYVLASPPA
jgi:SAM-dependent methyltransferase